MTSASFQISYASVANALFEHIEQDLLALTTALLDDEDESPRHVDPCTASPVTHDGTVGLAAPPPTR